MAPRRGDNGNGPAAAPRRGAGIRRTAAAATGGAVPGGAVPGVRATRADRARNRTIARGDAPAAGPARPRTPEPNDSAPPRRVVLPRRNGRDAPVHMGHDENKTAILPGVNTAIRPPLADGIRGVLGGQWQGGRELSGGAWSKPTVWYFADENNAPTDRIVVKDCWFEYDQWHQLNKWHGDPRTPEGEIAEISAMKAINGCNGASSCIECLHSERDNTRRWFRIYMPFVPHGDLHALLKNYMPLDGIDRGRHGHPDLPSEPGTPDAEWFVRDKQGREQSDWVLPEPFIWSVFESLAEACVLMETGNSESAEIEPNWNLFVHRDIKPANIYLDAPRADKWPAYPHLRLGDFGLALFTSEDDPMNPEAYNGYETTPGWSSAEMLPLVNSRTKVREPVGKILGWSNVWGVGAVLAALCNGYTNPDSGDDREMYSADPPIYGGESLPRPLITPTARQRLTSDLTDLVDRCTDFWPEDRVSAFDLLEEIRAYTGQGFLQGYRDHSQGMRTGGSVAPELNVTYSQDDLYRIGLSIPRRGGPRGRRR